MKKSILKKATIMVIVLLVAIQFFKTKENKSIQVSENAITQHYDVPENIQNILKQVVTIVIPITPIILGTIKFNLLIGGWQTI